MTATEIKSVLELRSGQKLNHKRLGVEIRNVGFVREKKTVNGCQLWGYNLVKCDSKGQ